MNCNTNFTNRGPRSEVVTQRSAKPFTPVQIRPWPQCRGGGMARREGLKILWVNNP